MNAAQAITPLEGHRAEIVRQLKLIAKSSQANACCCQVTGEVVKIATPTQNKLSWYPTQAETLQTQRDQLAAAKREAQNFAQAGSAAPKTAWWTRVFWRV